MRKAASLGLSAAKPWGEGERYDVIVRVENVCWRVQVKSVLAKSRGRRDYRVKTSRKRSRGSYLLYSATEIDFLVASIFSEDIWYVSPASFLERQNCVWVSPGSKRSKFEKYREAWKLMKPAAPEIAGEVAREASAGT